MEAGSSFHTRASLPAGSGRRWWLMLVLGAIGATWPFAAAQPDGTARGADDPLVAPIYTPDPTPPPLLLEFSQAKFARDPKSGNYLSAKVFAKTLDEEMVPILINRAYVKDLRGRTVFVRSSIRDKLLRADSAMFAAKGQHLVINYGFRSNALQRELFQKLNGVGKVAPAGGSFHETGMALDLQNWREAQRFMIEAGFVGGCYGIEEDLVHYSVGEISKASNAEAFQRCTLKEIPANILKGAKKIGSATASAFGKLKRN